MSDEAPAVCPEGSNGEVRHLFTFGSPTCCCGKEQAPPRRPPSIHQLQRRLVELLGDDAQTVTNPRTIHHPRRQ